MRAYLVAKSAFAEELSAGDPSKAPDWDSYDIIGFNEYHDVMDRAWDTLRLKTAPAEDLWQRVSAPAKTDLNADCAGAFADCYIMQFETRSKGEP